MEANKYYTPKIEDIFLSYECEIIQEDGSWKPIKVDTFQNNISLSDKSILDNLIRTKYLDEEDFKELGFVVEIHTNVKYPYMFFAKGDLGGMIKLETKEIHIYPKDPSLDKYCSFHSYFRGVCSSKNELKKILNLLIK